MAADRGIAADLTRSVPPVPAMLGEAMRRTLAEIAQEPDLALINRNSVAGGTPGDRHAGAAWLAARFGGGVCAERVVVTNGTQNAVTLLLQELVGAGGVLAAEALTYGVLKPLAERVGVRLRGVAVDGDGLLPEDFAQACREAKPRALFCNPTVQNPTTAVMPVARRKEIAAIARAAGVAIIEDEPLGVLHADAPPPIAATAPDVTWYVMGLTKCIAHGMRLAYLVAPDAAQAARLVAPVRRLSTWFPAPLNAELMRRWIADGTAQHISRAIRDESIARQRLAAPLLRGLDVATRPDSLHLWLHLPPEWPRAAFTAAAAARGVAVRPADAFAVDDRPQPEAVRLALSSPLSHDELSCGLRIVAELVRGRATRATPSVCAPGR